MPRSPASRGSSPASTTRRHPTVPLRRARFDYAYDDYAHLARVAEWSVPGEDEEIVAMSGHRA